MSIPGQRVRVWDLPTRLFHWLLAACVIGAYVCIKLGGLWVDYHFLFGYAVLALIVFRLIWGVVGPPRARFVRFVRGPTAVWAYLRGRLPDQGGHNPLGALSVVAMLLAFAFQATSGLFTNDDIMSEGPLVAKISKELSDRISGLHHANEWILIGLVGLHIAAIAYYVLVKRKRIVTAMVTGDDKAVAGDVRESTPDNASVRLRGLVVALVSVGIVWGVVQFGRGGF
jgi:cytochrome b